MNDLVEMQGITKQAIQEALQRIRPLVHQTPLQYCRTISEVVDRDIYFKLENLQKTGSFKIRGASNKIYSLTPAEAACGVITASAGNHAQGVALAATACRVPSIVVMPTHAPLSKVRATETYGAKVILHGQNYDEAYQHARQLQEESHMTFIHAFDDDAVIAGQGTIAIEILSKLFDVDAIIAPVGGGGLIAGLAVAIKEHNPKIKVLGVQAEGAPAMALSFAQNCIQEVPSVRTIADGIAVKRPGDRTFHYIQQYVDDIVLVSEEEICNALVFMLERGKMITEGAGVTGVAAVLANKIGIEAKKVAVIVSGGNIDPLLLSSIIRDNYQQATGF